MCDNTSVTPSTIYHGQGRWKLKEAAILHTLKSKSTEPYTHTHIHVNIYIYICVCVCVCV
jgi:hypothetical protein